MNREELQLQMASEELARKSRIVGSWLAGPLEGQFTAMEGADCSFS